MLTQDRQEAFLYEQVVAKMTRLISEGIMRPGERIPSVRRLSRQERISVSTVLQAYFLLESQGLIEARPQSGFYVRARALRLPPEPKITNPPMVAKKVDVSDLVFGMIEAIHEPGLVPLGAACVSSELFPNHRLIRTLASAARRAGADANTYPAPAGLPELRRQIARRALVWGGELTAEDIIISCGCTEALNLCLRAVARPGDIIAVESPTYYVLLQIIESLGMKALEIPTDSRAGICLNGLERALEKHPVKACLVMPNFHNPLGSCMPDEKKKKLVSLLARREVPVIEDDIYGDLSFAPERPRTLKAFDRKGLVLLCSSFSKTLAPGYRVGWIAPGRFKTQVERLKTVNTLGTPVVMQMMLADFLQSGGYDHYLRRIRKACATHVQLMTRAVGQYFPDGTKITRPEGGLVLWVEMPPHVDALELHRRALESHISIAPGPMFSASQSYRNCIRLNCGCLWSERVEGAIRALGQMAAQMRPLL
ncbi:MAG: PLP-dependent aminotransferase family protein [Acidobacteriota bacterium]